MTTEVEYGYDMVGVRTHWHRATRCDAQRPGQPWPWRVSGMSARAAMFAGPGRWPLGLNGQVINGIDTGRGSWA
jgi:hypothetical protein